MRQRWEMIAHLIIDNKYQVIAEIGPSKGETVRNVCKITIQNRYPIAKYYGIDPYLDPYYAMKRDIKDKLSMWTPWQLLQMTSDQAYEYLSNFTSIMPLDLVFVDGDHSPEQKEKDIVNYTTLLRQGGCIVIHDYNDWGGKECKTMIHRVIGENNLNVEPDARMESGKPSAVCWTYKSGDGYAKKRPD